MGCHVAALVWGDVDNDASAGWGEGTAVEIEETVEAGVGRESWLAAGRPK
jgi:hypothetical protein